MILVVLKSYYCTVVKISINEEWSNNCPRHYFRAAVHGPEASCGPLQHLLRVRPVQDQPENTWDRHQLRDRVAGSATAVLHAAVAATAGVKGHHAILASRGCAHGAVRHSAHLVQLLQGFQSHHLHQGQCLFSLLKGGFTQFFYFFLKIGPKIRNFFNINSSL